MLRINLSPSERGKLVRHLEQLENYYRDDNYERGDDPKLNRDFQEVVSLKRKLSGQDPLPEQDALA